MNVTTIVLIPGLWMTALCWEHWVKHYTDKGYRVIAAQHGREAMDIATKEAGHIDLVLTDIVMPGMNGRGLVERLAGIRPRIKSLYMSGYTDDDIVRRGFIEPSKSFLQKPFTSEALLQTVRKVLDEG